MSVYHLPLKLFLKFSLIKLRFRRQACCATLCKSDYCIDPGPEKPNYIVKLHITCFKCCQRKMWNDCASPAPCVCLYLFVRGCNPLVSIQLPFSYRDYANRSDVHSCFIPTLSLGYVIHYTRSL